MIEESAPTPGLLGVPGGVEVDEARLRLMADQIRVNGYTILEGALPLSLIDRMRDRFDELLEMRIRGETSNRGPNRYQMYLPFEPPFADPLVYEHPLVMRLLEQVLGQEIVCTYFASDTPVPGSEYQRIHADTRLLFPETTLSLPSYGIVVNIPLVDFTRENGALEIWPGGTHLMPGRQDLQALAPHLVSIRPEIKAGSILVRDLRMWHRGTPNRSSRSRPNMALVYTRSWYRFEQRPFELTRSAYEGLSERFKAMCRFNTIVEE